MMIDHGTQFGLLGFISPSILLRLLHRLPSVSPKRWGRLLAVLGAGASMLPLAAAQSLRYGSAIARSKIEQPPVFIIGHWRSGTTHLHNVLSQDEQFGCVRMFECVAPACSVVGGNWLPQALDRVMPAKRPMDNMDWPMAAPQEDEIALAKLTPYSWYLQFLFPQDALSTFERYVLLEGAPATAKEEVQSHLLRLLKIANMRENGKRLLLKNPVHTARIPQLLSMFPDARFVYLHRSPLEVFPSAKNLHRKILELTSLQSYDEALIESNVLALYPRLLERYHRDKGLLADNQLIEVGYAELISDPQTIVQNIYQQLELPGYTAAAPRIESYVKSLQGYKKNHFAQLTDREEALVREQWTIGWRNQ